MGKIIECPYTGCKCKYSLMLTIFALYTCILHVHVGV